MLPLRDCCQTVLPDCVQCILHFNSKGYKAPTIQKFLATENFVYSCNDIAKFIKVFERTRSICRQPGSGRPSEVTREVKDLVVQQMVWGIKLEINNKFLQKVRGGSYSKERNFK